MEWEASQEISHRASVSRGKAKTPIPYVVEMLLKWLMREESFLSSLCSVLGWRGIVVWGLPQRSLARGGMTDVGFHQRVE